jgi:hypothetical protein
MNLQRSEQNREKEISGTFIVTSSAPSATMIRTGGACLSEFIYRSCTARREFFTNSNIMRCRCGVTYLQSRFPDYIDSLYTMIMLGIMDD